ncbi:sigma-70 family RNA polymerase sigma factor [Aggregicoccus sp. 17bor-14]|uniref:sigma-70 family RNA polymerase sigma factor n=1 Tax=Myxococcaceae TaxID=31 RepID=UPI00129C5EF6|nr:MULTISPECIES: sigma-70 family RNA polymerase sigma factor [Myxococcaceae]MBF5042197.1 sigma-70 family RNA polymerase sigma factor [Simulacricoccus sp. 17bor-14]MRI87973.1 sigma-70 family RNA polymerase sigma factor [Aggregicoccus sp. 17bor-14]
MSAPTLPLSRAFLQARAGGTARASMEAVALDASHERALERLVAGVQARWPELSVDPVDFVRHLAERLPSDSPDDAAALEAVAAEDLYLALGCLRDDPRALAAFERAHLREVGAFVAHLDRTPAFADEVRQALRERLFTGEKRISEYGGSGALGGWVRVAALRIALNLRRGAQRADASERRATLEEAGVTPGPERAFLKAHYREHFAEALRASVGELSDRERALLRLYHLEGLSLEALAALYAVHLSTVSRWLGRARARLAEQTTQALRERLDLEPSEADSLAALVLSQLDLSLAQLLGRGN